MPLTTDSPTSLRDLAAQEFSQLTEADKKFFDAVDEHKAADFRVDKTDTDNTDNLNSPASADKWGKERTLKADRIVWLLTTPKAVEHVSFRGLQILGAKIEGEVNLEYVTVAVPLIFNHCKFTNRLLLKESELKTLQLEGTQVAGIQAQEICVKGSVSLCNGFKAEGEVNLLRATSGGQLDCSNGEFKNPKGVAIQAAATTIAADVFLRNDFEAEGEVNLIRATIGGQLACSRGKFRNKDKTALNANAVTIAADVFLSNGFEAEGEVNLIRATIGGNLRCTGGHFLNKARNAINAEGAAIGGSVFLGGRSSNIPFQAEGKVIFLNATIDDQLGLEGMKISNDESMVLNHGLMVLDLRFAKTNIFSFSDLQAEQIWIKQMEKGQLYLNGFVYSTINASNDAIKDKLLSKWLKLQIKQSSDPQSDNGFALQPYEQLAAVLKANGHQEAATEVLIAKENDRRSYGGLTGLGKAWNWFLGLTIAHGYRPQRALLYSMLVMLLGWGVFWLNSPLMKEADDDKSKFFAFDPLVYSIDVFTPVVDLHQESVWLPDASQGWEISLLLFKARQGDLLRTYFWFQIVAGWVLTSLWVAGFTGLVRSQK